MRRSEGTVMHTGKRVGFELEVLVCSNRLWASATVGRMSSLPCAAMMGKVPIRMGPGQMTKEAVTLVAGDARLNE